MTADPRRRQPPLDRKALICYGDVCGSRTLFQKRSREVRENAAATIMKNSADQEFLEFLVKSIVDHPDDVKVDRRVDEMGVLLTLRVHAQDMGQVVGRQGATAKAIRSLLRIVGIKNSARVNLKIEEPEGAAQAPRRPAA